MVKSDGTLFGKITKKGAAPLRENIFVFAFFLLLSFIFWYLNSLGKDLEADIRYPVRYINSPDNTDLGEETPSRLTLFLKGPGYSIVKLKMSGKRTPVVIDLSQIALEQLPDKESDEYFIITSGLVQNFNSQLKSVCKISSVRPDTLFLTFTRSSE
ncbi:MAG: hypothetical protein JXN62_06110 [Bacteroidales bacterium]|nr:hypothetical protein [Bacteroidales bacterium]